MNSRYLEYIDEWTAQRGRQGKSLLSEFTLLMCSSNIPPGDWMRELELMGGSLLRRYKATTRKNYLPVLKRYIAFVVREEHNRQRKTRIYEKESDM